MFKKLLIANRGEIAVRVIRACRELGIAPVVVYSTVDRDALHVRLAEEAYEIGPPPPSESYLRIDRILDIAERSRSEAIHPGYGFLAESARFAQACRDAGRTFIGPDPGSIELMGNKIASRAAVAGAGVATVPGSDGPVRTLSEAEQLAAGIGYPLLLKASAGGGGKGMRLVDRGDQLAGALAAAQGEAASAFGDSTVYIEKYVGRPRHIEVQLLADQEGNLLFLGERECSIQRRHQKLVEESPSPRVGKELRRELAEAAFAVARAADYRNAGTVEFMVDASEPGERPPFYFLEMNTRLQVEHPVTELVTGMDLVKEQIRIAAGLPVSLRPEEVRFRGWSLECRIYAEDPKQGFLPSPGKIEHLEEPAGPGIRNDSGVYEGFRIPYEYDPLISKLISWGVDRGEAIERMRRALREYRVGGVHTTLGFFERLLSLPEFRQGDLHTHFIEEHRAALTSPSDDEEERRAVAAAALARILSREERSREPLPRSERRAWKEASRRFWW